MKLTDLGIREILTTNAEKTIEVELETINGSVRSSVPIGTSRGKYEVSYLPVADAVKKFMLLKRDFIANDFADQKDVDGFIRKIDKTSGLREIGGNLALAISSAFLKGFALEAGQTNFEYIATQAEEKITIPKPICNIIGGGKHAGRIDIQEFHLLPLTQKSFLDSITKIAAAYRTEGKELKENDPTFSFTKNIESAWTTNLSHGEILRLMEQVAEKYELKLGIDFAASSLWNGNRYVYCYWKKAFNKEEQISFVKQLARKFPIHFIEDPLNEDDFMGFSILTGELQPKLVCGDDLFATNIERLKDGLNLKAANAAIIKPNQVGTITDTIEYVKEAKKNELVTVMSHRSSETDDTLICHLAVGLGCDYIKIGIGGGRATKINEMIRIEEKTRA